MNRKWGAVLNKVQSGFPVVMGILNITPDSFSENGANYELDRAVAAAQDMAQAGADIIDVGGESTRPGADPVSAREEIKRVIPVIREISGLGPLISIDTRHAHTMEEALSHGAAMVNDITALEGDSESLKVVAGSDAVICLMHMQGRPQTMQQNPSYGDVGKEVCRYLKRRVDLCINSGISAERIVVDPGIGFGKSVAHNLDLLRELERFQELGLPVLIGASRKSFIEKICRGQVPPKNRLPGSLAACLWAYERGVRIFRVHDVKETLQAFDVWTAFHRMEFTK